MRLRHRLQVGERRRDHLSVAQREVHHLVAGHVVNRDGQDGLRRYT